MKLSDKTFRKFEEQKPSTKYEVLTDTGFEDISMSNKTIKYFVYEIEFSNGTFLKCADNHILIDASYNEIFAKDSLGVDILSKNGATKVTKVTNLNIEEHMYDLSINSDNHTYYTNDVLSHNTVTVATYLVWKALFSYDKIIGIAANKHSMAVEVLDKMKNIFINLPIWLMSGVTSWNKQSVSFDNGTRVLTSATNGDSFRGFSLDIAYIDEVSFIRPTMYAEFGDSVYPAVTAKDDSQIILSSTPNGLNHFYTSVQGAKEGTDLIDIDGFQATETEGINGFKLSDMEWNEVPGRDDQWRSDQIAENGLVYFNQNFGLDFQGSSDTLLSAPALQRQFSEEPEFLDRWIDGMRVYEMPEEGRKYIASVDAAKDGIDKIAIQIIDVTEVPFRQVAVCNTDASYLKIASEIVVMAQDYNNAFLIIENNEGAGQSLNDMIYNTYDYDNLYKEPKGVDGKLKRYYGFRTTSKSRKLILSLLKVFIENDRILIKDSRTIDEFFHFINIKGKYQADDGYHDDMIMALALIFAPIIEIKNFEDQKKFIENMFNLTDDDEAEAFEDVFSFAEFDNGIGVDDTAYKNRFSADAFNVDEFGSSFDQNKDDFGAFGD
jgi:hypothetical protein